MQRKIAAAAAIALLFCYCLSIDTALADNPYRFFDWKITYGVISPFGVKQQGILINGQFPGPDILCNTNDNVIVNVYNSLPEPFLISWNGIQQRKNSYEDGMMGTTCPIPPGKNFTYILQAKDQIGSFYYFPSLAFHKAAGGYGGIRVISRPLIPVPFDPPADDFTVLIGDGYKANHTALKARLAGGHKLLSPDGILINGRSSGATFTVEQGKTYRFRISNIGLQNSLNFRIQNHSMLLVEVEGTHTLQSFYSSVDIHVGQSVSVLVTANQSAKDYYIVASTRFAPVYKFTTAALHYSNSQQQASGPLPGGPTEVEWSLDQARSFRTNLTASGPRPNPQGSYHYGLINTTRTIRIANSAGLVGGKQRYAVNGVSFVAPDTPMKLADRFKISGVYTLGSIADFPPAGRGIKLDTSVMPADYRVFYELVFENKESIIQSWHINGYAFWVVGMDGGKWTPAARTNYNLRDALVRSTVQVYPRAWTAIYMAIDNVGMWNIRSEFWARQYLGQQFYFRVYTPVDSVRDEYPLPTNALRCGRAPRQSAPPL